MRLRLAFLGASLTSALLLGNAALGQPASRPVLRVPVAADVSITTLAFGALIAGEALKHDLNPDRCRLCQPPTIDLAARRGLRWQSGRLPDIASTVTGFFLTPMAMIGLDAAAVAQAGGSGDEWAEDMLVLAEATAISGDINQIIKIATARERPYMHFLAASERRAAGADGNMSFYSGHTAIAFTAAVSGGTIASLKGYPSAGLFWAAGLTLASLTGYLRIAADRHYLLDVVAGAAAGSAIGALIPLLHRPAPQGAPLVTAGPPPAPAVISLRGVW